MRVVPVQQTEYGLPLRRDPIAVFAKQRRQLGRALHDAGHAIDNDCR
jgi:hypothetical protein